jgi:hypothetical protein
MYILNPETPGAWLLIVVLAIWMYLIAAIIIGGIVQWLYRVHLAIEAHLRWRRCQKLVVPETNHVINGIDGHVDITSDESATAARDIFDAP